MTQPDTAPRPSCHPTLTKSYAIDQITDIEHLRRVAHRMWEALSACHQQSAHAMGVLMDPGSCRQCLDYIGGDAVEGCEEYQAWQSKVTAGFGSV